MHLHPVRSVNSASRVHGIVDLIEGGPCPPRARAPTPLQVNHQEAVFVVDASGILVDCNRSAARILDVEVSGDGRRCHELLSGRAQDGTPICRADCPYLGDATDRALPSPIDMIVGRGGQAREPGIHEFAVRHIPTVIRGQGLVIHLLEDVGGRRSPARVGARLQAFNAGSSMISSPLSGRELEVLRLVADGLTDRQVAERLGMHPTTARNHMSRILDKLEAPNRTAALFRFLITGDPETRRASTMNPHSSRRRRPTADATSSLAPKQRIAKRR